MASEITSTPNVSAGSDSSKESWPVAQARVSDDDLYEIDRARIHARDGNRTEFLIRAIFNAVRAELGYERISDAEKALLPKAS